MDFMGTADLVIADPGSRSSSFIFMFHKEPKNSNFESNNTISFSRFLITKWPCTELEIY